MLVNNFLENSAKTYPDKVALITRHGRYTYREIDTLSNRLANALISDGLQRGDRVVIFFENSLETVVAIFGVLKAGGVFLVINPSTKSGKLNYILNNSRASHLIAHGRGHKLSILTEACIKTPHLTTIYLTVKDSMLTGVSNKKIYSFDKIINSGDGTPPASRTIDLDLATIIYTSGSTGMPKGVMMAHFNMVSAANSITRYLENTPEDIILNTLPLSFDYGLYQVLMGFKVGATVILEKTFMYPYKVIDILIKEKVTGFPIVPTMSAILIQLEDIKKHRFDHLRYITNTAAALPPSHIKRLREFFPHTKIYSMYGLTECKRVSYLPPDQLDVRPTSVGKAMPNTDVYIVDEQGNSVGPGVVGELVVRGANVMRGYWEMPEETSKVLKPGPYPGEMVLSTGDLFMMDEEGYLYFVARKDDIIKSRGEKVSPREIENVLCEMDGVVESAVVGVPDPVLGEAIKAFVVLKEGVNLSEKDILRFCSMHLEDYAIPEYVEIRKSLPLTPTGKVNKRELVVT